MTPYSIYVFFGYNLNVNYRNMTFVIDRVALAKQGDNVLGSIRLPVRLRLRTLSRLNRLT